MARVQLALNVSDVDAAVEFYSKLFGVVPAKRRAGYANFAVDVPPLKLVLIENPDARGVGVTGALNHLGVEVESTGEVTAATTRLAGAGLETAVEENTACCYAVQDKVWVDDPDVVDGSMPTLRMVEPGSGPGSACACGPGVDCSPAADTTTTADTADTADTGDVAIEPAPAEPRGGHRAGWSAGAGAAAGRRGGGQHAARRAGRRVGDRRGPAQPRSGRVAAGGERRGDRRRPVRHHPHGRPGSPGRISIRSSASSTRRSAGCRGATPPPTCPRRSSAVSRGRCWRT